MSLFYSVTYFFFLQCSVYFLQCSVGASVPPNVTKWNRLLFWLQPLTSTLASAQTEFRCPTWLFWLSQPGMQELSAARGGRTTGPLGRDHFMTTVFLEHLRGGLVNTARGGGRVGTALTQQDTPGVKVAPPSLPGVFFQEAFFRVSFTSCFHAFSFPRAGKAVKPPPPRPPGFPYDTFAVLLTGEAP